MRIAFLSSANPHDVRSWSGTLFNIYKKLSEENTITWIGRTLLNETKNDHISRNLDKKFIPEEYSIQFGERLSIILTERYFDIVIARDYFFTAFLKINIPIVYIGDTTFHLFNRYLRIEDKAFIKLANKIERLAIHNAKLVIYSSEWAKYSAVNFYKADQEKIKVIEFGDNLYFEPVYKQLEIKNNKINLLFIGNNWKEKGGEKTVEIHNQLISKGYDSKLIIIGCNPLIHPTKQKNIHVIPHIDKGDAKDRARLHEILLNTHFLLFPTLFDCFGIVICEASAYGIPSLVSKSGGVKQTVKDGKNGFLFNVNSGAKLYADKIEFLATHKGQYECLRKKTRQEYLIRLNWNVWITKVNKLLKQT